MPGDVILTAHDGWIGRAIRKFTRDKGEPPSHVNHAAVVIEAAREGEDPFADAVIAESLRRVVKHRMRDGYGHGKSRIFVARPSTLSADDIDTMLDAVTRRIGEVYGYGLIGAHLGDYILGRITFRKRTPVWLRRFFKHKRTDCSGLVTAAAFLTESLASIEKDFGIPGYAATPDDMYDFIMMGKHYTVIRELAPWPREAQ